MAAPSWPRHHGSAIRITGINHACSHQLLRSAGGWRLSRSVAAAASRTQALSRFGSARPPTSAASAALPNGGAQVDAAQEEELQRRLLQRRRSCCSSRRVVAAQGHAAQLHSQRQWRSGSTRSSRRCGAAGAMLLECCSSARLLGGRSAPCGKGIGGAARHRLGGRAPLQNLERLLDQLLRQRKHLLRRPQPWRRRLHRRPGRTLLLLPRVVG
eukprot:SAG11_NODE_4001_length_2113_cov_1.577954_2_plen_213_part_00